MENASCLKQGHELYEVRFANRKVQNMLILKMSKALQYTMIVFVVMIYNFADFNTIRFSFFLLSHS